MPRDYYDILGVDRRADDATLKKAFRKLAQKYHPDVSKEPDAEERFKEINEAYQILSDSQRRRAYDQFGHAGVNMGAGGAGFSGGFAGFEDIMEDLFSAFTGRTRSSSSSRRSRARSGRDLRYDLNVSFEQAVFGDDIPIDINRWEACDICDGSGAEPGTSPVTCSECQGSGQVRQMRQTFLGSMVTVTDCPRCSGTGQTIERPCTTCKGRGKTRRTQTLTVNIPAGVDDGTQIRLSGEGEPGEHGGPPGNLYIVLTVEPSAIFQRRGIDILLDININVAQAALGDSIIVPTIDGDEEIRIESGTQTGTVITLKNKGVPRLRPDGTASGRGSQLVIVNVAIPTKLNSDQRRLFEELAGSLEGETIAPPSSGKGFFERMAGFFGGE